MGTPQAVPIGLENGYVRHCCPRPCALLFNYHFLQFRRLLLVSMLLRCIMIPLQLLSPHSWIQLLSETFPEVAFISAWMLLVSFFVQLVAVAQGTPSGKLPKWIFQIVAFVLYSILMLASYWNPMAPILLYAVFSFIYASLFGTTVYFCPQLVSLLRPSLRDNFGLASRLFICFFLCLSLFATKAGCFAGRVIATPFIRSWAVQYGALELAPATFFLLMMHPASHRQGDAPQQRRTATPPPRTKDSRIINSGGTKRSVEYTTFIRPTSGGGAYGSLTQGGPA